MIGLLARALVLAVVYLLALASLDPVDALVGLGLGVALAVALRSFTGGGSAVRAGELPGLVLRSFLLGLATLREILVGTWHVTLVVLHLRPLVAPGIVAVPVGSRTPAGVALNGLLTTLAPGEFLVDVDWDRRVMLVHVLDASDPDAVRARIDELYHRYQEAVVP